MNGPVLIGSRCKDNAGQSQPKQFRSQAVQIGLISSHFFLRLRQGRHPWRDLTTISQSKQMISPFLQLKIIQNASIIKSHRAGNGLSRE